MIAITTGFKFADIDAVASSFALHELYSLLGKESRIILPLNFSSSITSEMYNWFDKDIVISLQDYSYPEEEINILDVSEQAFISPKINRSKISLLYDHHYGFEEQWVDYNIPEFKIEHIGATATQVFELFCKYGLLDKMSSNTANLLYVTIITHTLNLKSKVTTARDIEAVKQLENHISINRDWIANYYALLEKEVLANIQDTIENDTKFSNIQGVEIAFGQLELWDGAQFIENHLEEIESSMKVSNHAEWLFSIPSISEGKNYVITNSERIKTLLIDMLSFRFTSNQGESETLLLRKEILKVIQ
jgi:inorganic pyrophosphatase/manganese-dependent inorganic pyrophosphatase